MAVCGASASSLDLFIDIVEVAPRRQPWSELCVARGRGVEVVVVDSCIVEE